MCLSQHGGTDTVSYLPLSPTSSLSVVPPVCQGELQSDVQSTEGSIRMSSSSTYWALTPMDTPTDPCHSEIETLYRPEISRSRYTGIYRIYRNHVQTRYIILWYLLNKGLQISISAYSGVYTMDGRKHRLI